MLAVALLVEMRKSSWETLLADKCIFVPPGNVEKAVDALTDPAIKALLEDVQQRSKLP
jgi:hypothetical protein